MASTNLFPCCSTQNAKHNEPKKTESGFLSLAWENLAIFSDFFKKSRFFQTSKNRSSEKIVILAIFAD
jgi:hypothetical protein